MIKKIVSISAAFFALLFVISCEKDFREINSSVIDNNDFDTKQLVLDVVISDSIVDAVRADNIEIGQLNEYLLGIYNNPDYKGINASIVSQLGYVANLKITDVVSAQNEEDQEKKIDSFYHLDKVILKLPYTATRLENFGDGKPQFKLDSLLGNPTQSMVLKVIQNETFLNTLDPGNPSQANSFFSDYNYQGTTVLNEDPNFSFTFNANDTTYVIERSIKNTSDVVERTFNDTIKITTSTDPNTITKPFLAVPLDYTKMKQDFWDKFNGPEFASSEAFSNYFRGLKIEVEGADGAMVPFQITGSTSSASVDFYYTISRYEIKENETDLSFKDSIPATFSFPLSGVRNSKYTMSQPQNAAPANSFTIQGTAGTMAKVNILNGTTLQELRSQNILITDASLVFNIDASRDTTKAPQRLLLYRNNDGKGEHIKDSYTEPIFFGGFLSNDEEGKPKEYKIRITDYISDLVSGEIEDNVPLVLKVFNLGTDQAVNNNVIQSRVRSYNWNPRGITLFNHSSTNGEQRAKLILSYSEEKESN